MDDADRAEHQEEMARQAAIRNNSRPLEQGVAGECDKCGELSPPRLVRGVCAPCRDRYKLP